MQQAVPASNLLLPCTRRTTIASFSLLSCQEALGIWTRNLLRKAGAAFQETVWVVVTDGLHFMKVTSSATSLREGDANNPQGRLKAADFDGTFRCAEPRLHARMSGPGTVMGPRTVTYVCNYRTLWRNGGAFGPGFPRFSPAAGLLGPGCAAAPAAHGRSACSIGVIL